MPLVFIRRVGALLRRGLFALAALAWMEMGGAWASPSATAGAASVAPAPLPPAPTPPQAGALDPVRIGMTGEFDLAGSLSAQAVALGVRAAIHHAMNAPDGGPLRGRKIVLETLSDAAIPARAVDNLLTLASKPHLLATFVGRHSPPAFDLLPLAHERGLILLSAWASADGLTTYPRSPNPMFRLALTDAVAIPTLLEHARSQGWRRIGAMVPNTAAGRSGAQALERALTFDPELKLTRMRWYNLGDQDMLDLWRDLAAAGSEAVMLMAGERETTHLLRDLAADANAHRFPVLAHGMLAGGDLNGLIPGRDVAALEFVIALSAHPAVADPARRQAFHAALRAVGGPERPDQLPGWMGAAQAYDLTTLVLEAAGRAEDAAGDIATGKVRAELEADLPFTGVTGHYPRPFSPTRHDAMAADKALIARMRPDASFIPVGTSGPRDGADR